jgi:hypothetical protein
MKFQAILCATFHPNQPWLLTAGSNGQIALFSFDELGRGNNFYFVDFSTQFVFIFVVKFN